MNWEQIKGIVERILTLALMYAVGKGWIPAGIVADLTAGLLLLFGVVWGWKVNTAPALADAAKAVK